MGMFYFFTEMVIWVYHFQRLICIRLICKLYYNWKVRKAYIKVYGEIGQGQTLNGLINGWISQVVQILSWWWRCARVCEAELCSSKLYILGHNSSGNMESNYWVISKVHRRNDENLRVTTRTAKSKVLEWCWTDLIIHRVFEIEEKEEFGWLQSCLLGSIGRCCTTVVENET